MSENTSMQEVKHWKQQYYNHLDLLEHKEKDWMGIESILKKTVLRLSIAAEGQNATIDRHLQDIRSVVKKQVNVIRLENTLDDISAVLLKMADKHVADDRKVVTMLARLLENIHLPKISGKKKEKLIKKLIKASDKDSDDLTAEVQNLLSVSIDQPADTGHEKAKSGLLKNLFNTKDKIDNTKINKKSHRENRCDDVEPAILVADEIGNLTAVSSSNHSKSLDVRELSAQEILIRLLEKLTFPPDLYKELESIKQRIQEKNSARNWKQLLNDVAQLVNTLRDQMHEEKQEFESFLQQVTSRLIEMDNFLLIENSSLNDAAQAGEVFDVAVSTQVQEIQADMNSANDLSDLKSKVQKRLSVVSDHIKQYRIDEQDRYSSAQKNVENMQSRLQLLEQESNNLKRLIVEKNREAMFDALTEIPNRLSYEKKAAEEIARCNRFSTPLSMAVWDVDLFKQVNDTYGHKVGDKVLQAIAQLLNERRRETDFVARYGGEEFVMFLPGADEADALEITDALREKISDCKFKHHGEILKITMSCGISSYKKNDSHEMMFERADKALYAAKHRGRNMCMAASSLD